MKRLSKLTMAGAALMFAVLAAPVASTPAAAAPAATTIDMMRALEGSNASAVEQVRHRRWHRHRHHCRWVRRCWRNHWGYRKCRWVRRCW